jgi:hypothetical protein
MLIAQQTAREHVHASSPSRQRHCWDRQVPVEAAPVDAASSLPLHPSNRLRCPWVRGDRSVEESVRLRLLLDLLAPRSPPSVAPRVAASIARPALGAAPGLCLPHGLPGRMETSARVAPQRLPRPELHLGGDRAGVPQDGRGLRREPGRLAAAAARPGGLGLRGGISPLALPSPEARRDRGELAGRAAPPRAGCASTASELLDASVLCPVGH